MDDFPGNSHNPLNKGSIPNSDKPQKNVQKVVSVDAVQRPKPMGKRFKEIFFGGEVKGASRYIFADVLLPAFRNMIVDATTKGIERVMFGDAPRRRYETSRPSRFSYNTPVDRSYGGYSRERVMLPDQPPRTPGNARRQDIGEIAFHSREDADRVLERLVDIVDTYQVASVADLHELAGLSHSHIDQKWGWTNLKYANVRQTRDGFLIDLPQPEPIS